MYNQIPLSSVCKESACSAGDLGSIPGQESPLKKEMQPTPVFLPEESLGQRSLLLLILLKAGEWEYPAFSFPFTLQPTAIPV